MDAGLLTSRHRRKLHGLLEAQAAIRAPEPLLGLAILHAYEKVGGSVELPYVSRLAYALPVKTRNADLIEAAAVCLPHIQERVSMGPEDDELLRAAESPQPNSLLRAPDVTLRPSTELLRADGFLTAVTGKGI